MQSIKNVWVFEGGFQLIPDLKHFDSHVFFELVVFLFECFSIVLVILNDVVL